MQPSIHVFHSSTDAYDECQCNSDISDGDILIVPEEDNVIALAGTWPVRMMGGNYLHHAFHEYTDSAARQRDFASHVESFRVAHDLHNGTLPFNVKRTIHPRG